MGIGTSLVLIAVGAILAFAVHLHSTIGSTVVHWSTVGWILMVIGVIGLLISLIVIASSRRSGVVTHDRVVERDPNVS
ncbi:MAG: DUF6458 family protein [Gaiellales bacterium]